MSLVDDICNSLVSLLATNYALLEGAIGEVASVPKIEYMRPGVAAYMRGPTGSVTVYPGDAEQLRAFDTQSMTRYDARLLFELQETRTKLGLKGIVQAALASIFSDVGDALLTLVRAANSDVRGSGSAVLGTMVE